MTADQYRSLLQELARISGLSESSGLIEHGRVKIGDVDAVLEHQPEYDANLLQVRMRMGSMPHESEELARAILAVNYTGGYGGDCVFSVYPATDDVIVTMRVKLPEGLSAKDLWQSISDAARHANRQWENAASKFPGVLVQGPSPMLHGIAA